MDFPSLVREIEQLPTVQAGVVDLLVRLRNAIELANQEAVVDKDYLTWLCGQLDSHAAVLGDAVVARTPAEEPHEVRAAQLQRQADQPNDRG